MQLLRDDVFSENHFQYRAPAYHVEQADACIIRHDVRRILQTTVTSSHCIRATMLLTAAGVSRECSELIRQNSRMTRNPVTGMVKPVVKCAPAPP